MNKSPALRVPQFLCKSPGEARCCNECAHNLANLPAGTWSPTPERYPVLHKAVHGCGDFMGVIARATR